MVRAVFATRLGHYALLVAAVAAVTLPNLGRFSLWDIDEGRNAEAAREMLEAGDWVVPTFNYQLRTAKPALLYWLQMASYSLLGVSEFSARLPSVLCALAAVLLVHELGRRMFGPAAGLLAGVGLITTIQACLLAHAATPDAVLLACTMLAFFVFHRGYVTASAPGGGGRAWFVPFGAACGLAVLAKGPIGLALPGLVLLLFLAWEGRLRSLLDHRLVLGALAFAVVALPWYVLVGAETKGEFLRQFLLHDNVKRFQVPLESHRGPVWFYLAVLIVGLAPWSVFLGGTLWYGVAGARRSAGLPDAERAAYRLLLCWAGAYLVFFSAAATKLPNYILPVYPPLMLLTAAFLDRWRRGVVMPTGWLMPAGLAGVALVGVITAAGMVVAAGAVPVSIIKIKGSVFPELRHYAVIGLLPILTAAGASWCLMRRDRAGVVASLAAGAVAYVGAAAAFPAAALEPYKAPKALVAEVGACRPDADVRVASFGYFQPSLVFYCRREVTELQTPEAARDFLAGPLPSYLFIPAAWWADLQPRVTGPHRIVGRHYDLYRRYDVVVITNQ